MRYKAPDCDHWHRCFTLCGPTIVMYGSPDFFSAGQENMHMSDLAQLAESVALDP